MIVLQNVQKRFTFLNGDVKWALRDVTLTIPRNARIGLVGRNGAGKSTLLRLIGGIDEPTRGTITRYGRISWPLGLVGGLQGSLTGRQNAKFVCRIHGYDDNMAEHLRFIQEFSELGAAFDHPIRTYSSGMQARLKFALSMIFDFDVYLVDELTAVGDAAFVQKSRAAFKEIAARSGLIMASHSDNTLRQHCEHGIWLHDGHAFWFDKIDDALKEYNASLRLKAGTGTS